MDSAQNPVRHCTQALPVRAALQYTGVRFVMQAEQRGTGHAMQTARPEVEEYENLIVLSGDAPMITPETILKLRDFQIEQHASGSQHVAGLERLVKDPRSDLGRRMQWNGIEERVSRLGIFRGVERFHHPVSGAVRETAKIENHRFRFVGGLASTDQCVFFCTTGKTLPLFRNVARCPAPFAKIFIFPNIAIRVLFLRPALIERA